MPACKICGYGHQTRITFHDPLTGRAVRAMQCDMCSIVSIPTAQVKPAGLGARNWATLGALGLVVVAILHKVLTQ